MYEVRFPSPVKSAHVENNTVHAQYYRPTKTQGPIPCVVVLDILAGAAARGEVRIGLRRLRWRERMHGLGKC